MATPGCTRVNGASAASPPHGLRPILDALPFAVAIFDANGALTTYNGRYTELTSTESEGVAGRTIDSVWPEASATLESVIDAARKRQHRATVLVELGFGSSPKATQVTVSPLPEGEGWIFTGIDVTERERLRRAMVRDAAVLHGERQREHSLSMIGQLAAGVLHDVNNVLNPILASAYLIDAFADDPESVKLHAGRIAQAAQMGVARLARLRQFVRQEPIEDRVDAAIVDISATASEVVELAAPMWEGRDPSRAIRVETSLATGVVVRGVGAEIQAATLNLINNAVDAMVDGGTLSVTTMVRDGQGLLEVSDTGGGMTADTRRHAFEPFFSTKGSRGTGLGLAEVYGIVKRHRGAAEIESAPGVGTVVRLRFPLASGKVTASPSV
jgi:PAS domain S-box-containing protein